MASSNLNIILRLQDQFTKPMVQVGKITKEQARAIKSCTNSMTHFSNKVRSGMVSNVKSVAKFTTALAGISGFLSVQGLKSYLNDATEAFNNAQEAAAKLESVLGNVPSVIAQGNGAAAKAAERLSAYAAELAKTGVVGKTVAVSGLQQLATFQITEESLKSLLPGMENLLAQQKGINATNEDAVSIANLIGKAMSGQTGALTKAGIIMDEYQKKIMQTGTESQRAATMVDILNQNVGGVNEALASTDAGKIKILQNSLGGAKVAIGEKVMKLKAQLAEISVSIVPEFQKSMLSAIDVVGPKLTSMMQWVSDHMDVIKESIGKVKDAVATVWQFAKPVLSFAIQHANVLIPAILGVKVAISSLSVIADISTKVGGFVKAINTAKTAFAALNLTFSLSPIGVIITVIAAAIAFVTILYQRCEPFRNFVNTLIDAFKELWRQVKEGLQSVWEKVKSVVGKIREKLQPLVDLISSIVDGMKNLGFGSSNAGTATVYTQQKALGTPYFTGGLTSINERGGEIVSLPSGTTIIPHDLSEKAVSGNSVTVNLTIAGNVIGNRAYMEEVGDYIARRVLGATV